MSSGKRCWPNMTNRGIERSLNDVGKEGYLYGIVRIIIYDRQNNGKPSSASLRNMNIAFVMKNIFHSEFRS